jgi:HAD superfamily hydrolase (TIGR01509 family)
MGVQEPSPPARRRDGEPWRRQSPDAAPRGLVLDFGGVVYDDTLWGRFVFRLLSRVGVHTSYHCFFRFWEREYLGAVYGGRREFCEAFEDCLRAVGLSRPQIEEIEAACQARREQWEAGARPLPGVRQTLGRLHRSGIALGLLTNSTHPAETLRAKLAAMGLGDDFDAVLSSIDLGCALPEPQCYQAAAESLGLPPGALAFVGHDAAELEGARRAGLGTIAFNHDADAAADRFLTRFEELFDAAIGPVRLAAAG